IALLAGGRLKLHNAINIRKIMTRRKPQIAPPFLKPTCFTSKCRGDEDRSQKHFQRVIRVQHFSPTNKSETAHPIEVLQREQEQHTPSR
ncbi:hypothetical protein PC116_g32011, partial [Phytophthora cactorum]